MKKIFVSLFLFCVFSCISAEDYKTATQRLINQWRKENNISDAVWTKTTELQKLEILLMLRQINHLEMRIAKLKQ
jgi:hypothetical protein